MSGVGVGVGVVRRVVACVHAHSSPHTLISPRGSHPSTPYTQLSDPPPDLRALLARSTSTESTSTGHYRDLLLVVRSSRGHAQRGIHTDPDGGEPTLEIGFDEFPACALNGSTACHAQCIPDCSMPSRCVPEELLCGELFARHDERRVRVAGVDLRCHELADQIDCERTSSTTVDSAAYLDAARRRRAALSNELTLLGLLGIVVHQNTRHFWTSELHR